MAMSSAPIRYTTRPRTVEAMHITRDNLKAIEEWARVRCEAVFLPGPGRGITEGVSIRSLDDKARAKFGDYLVRPLEIIPAAEFEAQFVLAHGEE